MPSVVELQKKIDGMKAVTRVLARRQRAGILELEREMHAHVESVDRFYAVLGSRNWVCHDSLPARELADLSRKPPTEAERELIGIYSERESLEFMVNLLRRFPPMRNRMPLLERAVEDHLADRWYAVALVLIAVMDGFVNDLDPSRRRGLHARDADELAAWDSVVGHHMGLAHAHATFTKSFRATSPAPVYELHRNGIVHGTLTNYDNIVVASKAWNRLFAVADWAASREARDRPAKPEPGLRDTLRTMARTADVKRQLAGFTARIVEADEPGFRDSDIYERSDAYLTAWQSRNYGAMSRFINQRHVSGSPGKQAGLVRINVDDHPISGYEIVRISFEAAAVREVAVELEIDGVRRPALLRWIFERPDGELVVHPEPEGEWFLYVWEPFAIIGRTRETDEE